MKRELDKFAVFEDWLLKNGASFSQLELRSYDDNIDSPKRSSSPSNHYHDSAEEKKETKEKSSGMDTDAECRPSEESEMRGVHAKSNIATDTICVAIPKKCLITVEMGQATEIGQIILRSDLDLDAPKHIFLMVFLLWDRSVNGDTSFFKPYYDILPKTLRNIPIFWSEEELECLKGSFLLTQIADRIDAITDDYYAICQVAPQLEDIATLEEFQWARMCVCSRNFGLQIDGHRTSALVPHADMLNHYRPRETKWSFDDELQAFTITTLHPIMSGAQVYDSYGQKCNHRFLLNYGFAVEDNREIDGFCPNEIPIELSIPSDDPLYSARYEFWTRGEGDISNGVGDFGNTQTNHALNAVMAAVNNISPHSPPTNSNISSTPAPHATNEASRNTRAMSMGSEESVSSFKRVRVCVSNNENTRILFSMLRVLASNVEELRAISTAPTLPFNDNGCSVYLSRALRGYTAANPDSATFMTMQHAALYRTCRDIRNPINLRNEKAAMQLLLQVVASALEEYPCSLPQDVADLMDEANYPKFSNKRHAKIQVRGEKEVLHHFMCWAQTAIGVIEVIETELANESAETSTVGGSSTPGFCAVIRCMEDDDDLHFTILRYCSDVLGALRKEAVQTIRRERDPLLVRNT